MIPVYVLPVIACILFIILGVVIKKYNYKADITDSTKRVVVVDVCFLVMIVFIIITVIVLNSGGTTEGTPIRLLTTTLDMKDVSVLYDKEVDTKNASLVEDDSFLSGNDKECKIMYKDTLFNKNVVERKSVLSVTQTDELSQERITISKCIVKERTGCFWKYIIGYKISVPKT